MDTIFMNSKNSKTSDLPGYPLLGGDLPPPAKILTNPPSLKFCPSPLMSPST